MDPDDLMMLALDAGAEDFSEEEDSFEILTDPDSFSEVRAALEEKGIPMAEAEVTMIPQTYVTLTDEDAVKNLQRTLDLLDEDALVRILTEPKSAICKQYKKLFELDGVQLEIEDDALREIAKEAMERKTGARGLRAIMENATLNLMYEIPSDPTIEKCVITKGVITGDEEPVLTYRDPSEDTDLPKKKVRKKKANTDNGESA